MYRKQCSLFVCLVFLPAVCLGDLTAFQRANQTGAEFNAVFNWDDANNRFMLTAKGALSSKTDAARPALKLSIGKKSWIEHVFALSYNNDLLLAFETNDGDEGNSHICRIKSSLTAVDWCQTVAGFNMYAATSGDELYLGAIGFVGRMNPDNGKLLWQHADLYSKDNTFNIVCPASETDSTITFYATTGIKGEAIKQITMDRKTGKIRQISVISNSSVCQ